MSETKSKIIQFRVTSQEFDTPSKLPQFLHSNGQTAYAKHAADTQTQANSNECDNGANCGITNPQTQCDGTANSPISFQITKFNEKE